MQLPGAWNAFALNPVWSLSVYGACSNKPELPRLVRVGAIPWLGQATAAIVLKVLGVGDDAPSSQDSQPSQSFHHPYFSVTWAFPVTAAEEVLFCRDACIFLRKGNVGEICLAVVLAGCPVAEMYDLLFLQAPVQQRTQYFQLEVLHSMRVVSQII